MSMATTIKMTLKTYNVGGIDHRPGKEGGTWENFEVWPAHVDDHEGKIKAKYKAVGLEVTAITPNLDETKTIAFDPVQLWVAARDNVNKIGFITIPQEGNE